MMEVKVNPQKWVDFLPFCLPGCVHFCLQADSDRKLLLLPLQPP